ncbi:MAG: hypothetical protein Q7V58_09450 [Actinomycetota bacterium]|nr:hypothetical protein [Actinomycetota bacterium]
MDGGLEGHPGGIQGLLNLLDEHQEAIEYDLIVLGLRLAWLGSPRLTWRDLAVIIRHSPRTSALAGAVNGDETAWSITDHLLAGVTDLLALANWQRSGKKSAPRPKPLPRPGKKAWGKRIGKDPIPIRDFNSWWEKGA